MDTAAITQGLKDYSTPDFPFSPAALSLPVTLPSGASSPLGALLLPAEAAQHASSSSLPPPRSILVLGRNLL